MYCRPPLPKGEIRRTEGELRRGNVRVLEGERRSGSVGVAGSSGAGTEGELDVLLPGAEVLELQAWEGSMKASHDEKNKAHHHGVVSSVGLSDNRPRVRTVGIPPPPLHRHGATQPAQAVPKDVGYGRVEGTVSDGAFPGVSGPVNLDGRGDGGRVGEGDGAQGDGAEKEAEEHARRSGKGFGEEGRES